MQERLKSLDFFGVPFQFKVFNKEKYNSLFGFFSTVITSIMFVIITYLFGRDLYYKEEPYFTSVLQDPKFTDKHPIT